MLKETRFDIDRYYPKELTNARKGIWSMLREERSTQETLLKTRILQNC
jgi:hypothetical protein